jgi:hypothetical protein
MTNFKINSKSSLNIEMVPSDDIERYESVAIHFMFYVLNMDYHACFISNESWLSDFAGCGAGEALWEQAANEYDIADKTGMTWLEQRNFSYQIYRDLGKAFSLNKVKEVYGLYYDTASTPLIEIFADIEQHVGLARILEENEHIVFAPKEKEKEPVEEKLVKKDEPFDVNTTTNSLLYAKHTGCSKEEAKAVITKRINDKHAGETFRPWRPSDDKKKLN